MRFETENLLIRDTIFDDLMAFYEWERDPAVTEFFSIEERQSREELSRKYFADLSDPGARQFTILSKNGKYIGRIVLADIIEGWKGEIWRIYIADPALRGKGLGTEAMRCMMDYCFRELRLRRLYLDFYTGNPAEYMYRKLGFSEEGVLRNNCRKNGRLYDVHLMSMLSEEYFALYGE